MVEIEHPVHVEQQTHIHTRTYLRCFRKSDTTFQGFAPARSSLLMKATLGTLYRFICLSTVML
jgi:hypothetical protein